MKRLMSSSLLKVGSSYGVEVHIATEDSMQKRKLAFTVCQTFTVFPPKVMCHYLNLTLYPAPAVVSVHSADKPYFRYLEIFPCVHMWHGVYGLFRCVVTNSVLTALQNL